MKKTLVFFAFILFSFSFSQCYIQGNATMKVSESGTYSVENATAKCSDCHSWEIIGDIASLENDGKQKSVRILPKKDGNFILTVTLQTEEGSRQCSKNIQVLNNVAIDPNAISSDCDITWINYKERKNAEDEVIFESPDKNEKYQFSWTVTYDNGDVKTSTSASPNFKLSKENGIAKVVTKISTAKCTRTFTKNYEATFWKFY